MGIRIQPKEIEIPDDPNGNPFLNDLLNRKESIEILTHIFGSIEGPCTMVVDAPWGAGKTTFIRLWHQYLSNNKFTVIRFNAWENDFYDDPFIALCAELSSGQNTGIDKNRLMKAGKEVMKHIAWNTAGQLIASASAGTINIPELVKAGETDYFKRLEQYQDAKKAISDFRDTLQNMAASASSEKQNRPLIVMIDELDRCRPSYAVELLEVAKHLFSVDNIVFVLVINRSELAHSIKAVYGESFDGEDYLRRFFDVDFQLPEPDRKAFIEALINGIQINAYLKRTGDPRAPSGMNTAVKLLQSFFSITELSLRQVAQAVHRLGLVFASMPNHGAAAISTATVALILRTINEALYFKFTNGQIRDDEVVETIFNNPEREKLQLTSIGRLFERAIILADIEITYGPNYPSGLKEYTTPLIAKYQDQSLDHSEVSKEKQDHAKRVLESVTGFIEEIKGYPEESLDFMYSVKRINLLI